MICSFSDSANADPLSDGKMLIKNSAALTWQHRELWSAKYQSGYTLTSTFSNQGIEDVMISDTPHQLVRINEQVKVRR